MIVDVTTAAGSIGKNVFLKIITFYRLFAATATRISALGLHSHSARARTSTRVDALKRPKRPLVEIKSSYGAHQKNWLELMSQ